MPPPLADGDRLMILPSIAGGRGTWLGTTPRQNLFGELCVGRAVYYGFNRLGLPASPKQRRPTPLQVDGPNRLRSEPCWNN